MNENTVELIGHYGGDLTHACSAWTSTSRELNEDKLSRIDKLLNMLAQSDPPHTSPFEKSFLHFLVTSDIASHIHIIKHRIAVSVNAESARYKELKDDKYYLPFDWPEELKRDLATEVEHAKFKYHEYLEKLVNEYGMDRKRAKETARLVLPYASQLTQDISFNFLSFMHFQKLRNHPDAQAEIRNIAKGMLDCLFTIEGHPFKHSLAAFGYEHAPSIETYAETFG